MDDSIKPSSSFNRKAIVVRLSADSHDRLYRYLWSKDPASERPGILDFFEGAIGEIPELDLSETEEREFQQWKTHITSKFRNSR